MDEPIIYFRYLLLGEDTFREMNLSVEEYFEPLFPDDDRYYTWSLPKYNHPWTYVDAPNEEIVCLNLLLKLNGDTLSEKYTFWNQGKNYVLELEEHDKRGVSKHILISLNEPRPDGLNRSEALRFRWHKDFEQHLVPLGHTIEIGEPNNGITKEFWGVDKGIFSGRDY